MQHQCAIIGIAGASASGKSLFTQTVYQELKETFGDQIGIIAEDSYYNNQDHMTMDERRAVNYDHPSSMDHALLVQHLERLRQGETVEIPTYCYKTYTRLPESVPLKPTRVLIVEGILLLADPMIRKQIDLSVFIDTPLDMCLVRRLKRDVVERNRTMDNVLTQYQATVRPMYFEFVQPSKQFADIIVPRGGKNRMAIDCLKASIEQLMA